MFLECCEVEVICKELQLSFSWIRRWELAAVGGAALIGSVKNQVQLQRSRLLYTDDCGNNSSSNQEFNLEMYFS